MTATMQRSELLPLIRSEVKKRLTQSPAFNALSADKRAEIAHDTVNAITYIAGGEDGMTRPTSTTFAGNAAAFAGPAATAPKTTATTPSKTAPIRAPLRAPAKGGMGEAARAGSEAFTEMIANVNFPQFVGGLIDGVFNSIVTTSIKQMEAYAELVKNVSKSVDQYMKDNVSENNARDYLLDKYPSQLDLDTTGDAPKLKPKEGADDTAMPDFMSDLGLPKPVTSLDEDNVEQDLVPAARRRIAMDRQQLLATMVMMGVNRLVVTNGTIEASCMFELDTSDIQKRKTTQTADQSRDTTRTSDSGADTSNNRTNKWSGKQAYDNSDGYTQSSDYSGTSDSKSSWFTKNSSTDTAKFKMTTVKSQDTEETINMHAQLSGKVKVNFKSDYFPMEKMIDALQINQIRDKSAAGIAPAQPAAPALPAPALPPMPAMPGVPGLPAAAPAPAPHA